MWGLHHAGGLELVEERVARIGWVAAGDSSELADDREDFKRHLRHTYPEESGHWVANAARSSGGRWPRTRRFRPAASTRSAPR